jgi:hypothetical protein
LLLSKPLDVGEVGAGAGAIAEAVIRSVVEANVMHIADYIAIGFLIACMLGAAAAILSRR